jgi:hypothetical protein
MGQKLNSNDAPLKDAQITLRREEYAGGMGQTGRKPDDDDESTAFALSSSAFERTTATLPHYGAPEVDPVSQGTDNIPRVVTIVCGVVATATEEV